MTRWLLLFFVFVMPVQFAWSASAVYCTHERAAAEFHVGHHEHVHAVSDAQEAAQPQEPAGAELGLKHADCSYCHANVTQALRGVTKLLEAPYGHSVVSLARDLYAYRTDPDIDRPRWLRAA